MTIEDVSIGKPAAREVQITPEQVFAMLKPGGVATILETPCRCAGAASDRVRRMTQARAA